MDLRNLTNPFPASDVEWRIQRCGSDGKKMPWATVLAYITNRAIMERLDEVVGPEHWRNEFLEWHGKGVLCGISILIMNAPTDVESNLKQITSQWVCKWDGAEDTNIEAIKGGLSGAMKRAAVHWGIGRYLYKLDSSFAKCSNTRQEGWNYQPKDRNGKYLAFWWQTPDLPEWALPKGTKSVKKEKPAQEPVPGPDPEGKFLVPPDEVDEPPESPPQGIQSEQDQSDNIVTIKGINVKNGKSAKGSWQKTSFICVEEEKWYSTFSKTQGKLIQDAGKGAKLMVEYEEDQYGRTIKDLAVLEVK